MSKYYNLICKSLKVANIFLLFMIVYMGTNIISNYLLVSILILNGAKMQTSGERKIIFGVSLFSSIVFLLLTALMIHKAMYMALIITIPMVLISFGPLVIDYKKMKG